MSASPRYASPRSRRRTLGPQVAGYARELGLPFLPWQRQVTSTALELHRGRPAYRDVVISVPRQSGKSSLLLAVAVWRMCERPGSRVVYAAQTRSSARAKLLSSWWPRLHGSPYGDDVTLYRQFGAEQITHANGSVLQLLSSSESSGHGETVDLVLLDECWAYPDARLEQSCRPAMVTRRDAQLWACSTAGTWRSEWWRSRLDAGIAAAQMGVDTGTACFDWSAPPGANPADEAVWAACMPALGRLAVAETVRADLAAMDLVSFARAYCNVWPDPAGEGWQVFSRDQWERARNAEI
jgi:phage terminase large subunit-like protein